MRTLHAHSSLCDAAAVCYTNRSACAGLQLPRLALDCKTRVDNFSLTSEILISRLFLYRKINIMDTMVQKLERYANNLEDIVDKRTEELIHEKKKTDQLLYRMLPA